MKNVTAVVLPSFTLNVLYIIGLQWKDHEACHRIFSFFTFITCAREKTPVFSPVPSEDLSLYTIYKAPKGQ